MNSKMRARLFIPICVLLSIALLTIAGCQQGVSQLPAPSSPTQLSSTLVPDIDLDMDIYVYARQEDPTTIPAEMANAPYDIGVESLALWGIPTESELVFGMGFTLTSARDASRLYEEIEVGAGGWKRLDGSTIFLVQGSGNAAESLQTAISNRDFKNYDDSESLEAVATLPSHAPTRPAAVAIAKPSETLIGLLTQVFGSEAMGTVNTVLDTANLKVVAAGLYSPRQIDITRVVEAMQEGSNISTLDMGLLVVVKSGLPGLVVEPALETFLSQAEFTETNLGGITLFRRYFATDTGTIPVLVRIEGSYIFAATAGPESYAETLITSVSD